MRRATSRTLGVAVSAVLLLGTTACSGTGGSATPASSTATSSSAAPASPSATSASPSVAADPQFPSVAGYAYAAVPPSFTAVLDGISATGTTTAVSGRAATDSTGEIVAIVVVATYKPALATKLDATPIATVLNGAATGAKASVGAAATATDTTLSGVPVKVLASATFAAVVAYLKGGKLIEVFGPNEKAAVAFATGYLAAVA